MAPLSGVSGTSEGAVLWAAGVFALLIIGLTVFFIDLGITEMRPQFIAF